MKYYVEENGTNTEVDEENYQELFDLYIDLYGFAQYIATKDKITLVKPDRTQNH